MPDTLTPARPVHPGRILRRELDARELDLTAAARDTGVDEAALAAILEGEAPVTKAVAEQLARAWEGQRAETWLALQQRFDEHPKNAHGGKREGAGRKPTGLVTKAFRVSATPEQLAAIEAWLAEQGRGNGAQAAGRALYDAARQGA